MKTLIAALSALCFTSAMAATNPVAPSATPSQGTLAIAIEVGTVMQITGANDVNVNWSGANDLPTITQNFCVFSNLVAQGSPYNLDITDPNGNNFSFSGNGQKIPFKMTFNNTVLTPTGSSVTVVDQTGSASPTCGGTPNATLAIDVPAYANLTSGTYSATLNLTVSYPTT